MSVLAIGPGESLKVAEVRAYSEAEDQWVHLEDMHKMVEGALPPIGDDPRRVVRFPMGFRAIYSIEQHPSGWLRHLSVSLTRNRQKQNPGAHAVAMLAREFGFAIGEDLRFTPRQRIVESPTFGPHVPNVFEPVELAELTGEHCPNCSNPEGQGECPVSAMERKQTTEWLKPIECPCCDACRTKCQETP